jgi:ATP-dependent exoDNAse (exonuclease V) beta subunit
VAEAREEEEGRPKDAAENAVQVMTIHKAKGLDFDHVYLLQHHKVPGGNRAGEAARVAERSDGVEYSLLRPGAATLGFHEAAQDADALAAAERVRTLYVAMTRAKIRLVLVGRWLEADQTKAVRRTPSHAALLLERRPSAPDLRNLMETISRSAAAHSHQEAGVRWVFPALLPREPEALGVSKEAAALASAARVAEDSRTILEQREAARRRERRPFAAVASASAEELDSEAALLERYGEETSDDGQRSAGTPAGVRCDARAIGTAIHRALEEIDFEEEPGPLLARCQQVAASTLSLLLGSGEREAALRRAQELLERFTQGPLFEHLRRLSPHILARELPLIALPEDADGAAVGYVSGAIDLLYRDPETGAVVVADYKTDSVPTEAEHARKVQAYTAQGAVYQRAVQEALSLQALPCFELWFLQSGRIERVEPSGAG